MRYKLENFVTNYKNRCNTKINVPSFKSRPFLLPKPYLQGKFSEVGQDLVIFIVAERKSK